MTHSIADMRAVARRAFDALLASAAARRFLPRHLPPPPAKGRIILLAGGKAAASMVEAAEEHYLDTLGFPVDRLGGIAVTCYSHGRRTRKVPVIQAGFPRPDLFGVAATERMLALADAAGADDIVIVLLSAGAEANLVAPVRGLMLNEKQLLADQLLRAGATQAECLSALRPLSAIKSGRLALRAAPAEVVTITLPDRNGLSPKNVGGTPSLASTEKLGDCLDIVQRYRIAPAPSLNALFHDPDNELPQADAEVFRRGRALVGLDPAEALAAAARTLEGEGYSVRNLGTATLADARQAAFSHAALALEAKSSRQKVAILSGGLLTSATGPTGDTSPNQQFALVLASTLGSMPGIVAMAAGTDGTDGGVGQPTDACGALIDPGTLERLRKQGMDADRLLNDNKASLAFRASGDSIVTGPTCTHAHDVRLILVDPALH